MRIVSLLLTLAPALAWAQPRPAEPPVQFVNLDGIVIQGGAAHPAVTLVDARHRVQFERLGRLSRDFLADLSKTAHDGALR